MAYRFKPSVLIALPLFAGCGETPLPQEEPAGNMSEFVGFGDWRQYRVGAGVKSRRGEPYFSYVRLCALYRDEASFPFDPLRVYSEDTNGDFRPDRMWVTDSKNRHLAKVFFDSGGNPAFEGTPFREYQPAAQEVDHVLRLCEQAFNHIRNPESL